MLEPTDADSSPPNAAGGLSRLPAPVRRWLEGRAMGRTVLGVALLLIGASAVVAANAVDAPLQLAAEGGNTPVNAGAGDPADLDAHNSPAIAENPTDAANLVVANRIDQQQFDCALHVSTDGGDRWQQTPVPIPAGEEDKCYAPDVAFDAAGTLYVSYVTLAGPGNVPHAVWLVSSDDGGETLSEPTRLGGEQWFQVRLGAHPREPEHLYMSWLESEDVGTLAMTEPGQPLHAAVSTDGGQAWSDPTRINDPARERVVAPSPAIGDDGQWYVAYLDLGDDRLDYHGGHQGRGGPPYDGRWELVVARSDDDGQTWQEHTVDEVVPTERFLVFLPPFPAIAVDDERVYAAFTDGRAADDPAAGADVWLWTSEDGGQTWDDGARVNDTPTADGSRQYLPKIDVAPSGRVDVLYYDRRADSDNVFNEVSLQSSTDGGDTFTDRLTVSEVAFDSRIGFGAYRDLPELGSRLGLLSGDERALAVWADTRAGTDVSGKQDLTSAEVAVAGGPIWPAPARTATQLGGAVLVAAGGLLVLSLATGHDRGAPRFGRPGRTRDGPIAE